MTPPRRSLAPALLRWPLLAQTFGANPPAATMIEAGLISAAHKIEIEVTAKLAE